MEVNEEIIEQYLKLKGFFYIHDIKFKVWGKKGGSNYSNIDFLTIDKAGNLYDLEIKFRSKYKVTKGSKASNKWLDDLTNQITRGERTEEIKKYSNKKPIKIIVSTYICFGKSDKKRRDIEDKIKDKAKGHQVVFWYFEDIIKTLKDKTKLSGRYDSPILQMIRLLKITEETNHENANT
ncbi:MAG: hypothetical protein QME12_02000 [Nanoarchaeota archaeon]|nr:hypothetical protein [Nanoarchaeota archaeon]